jgi:hypothetical protein
LDQEVKRTYTSTADWRAPFDPVPFQGIDGMGDVESQSLRPERVLTQWPGGRHYFDVSNFRAPYDSGYYQSGALRGLGESVPATQDMPPRIVSFVRTGEMGTVRRDVGAVLNQIPRWAYGVAGALALLGAWKGYRSWKQAKRGKQQ